MSSVVRLLTLLTLMVAAYGIALPLMPLAIRALAPPVSGFILDDVARTPDGVVRLHARIRKHWCTFVSLGFFYRDRAGQVWRVGYTSIDQPPGTDTNRPPGIQTLGPWRIAPAPVADASHLHITVRHRCGPFVVTTPLADLDLKALRSE